MKLFKYGLPLAALALMASCSNDNLGEPANNGQTNQPVLGDGYYIDLNMTMPSIGTRDGYSDGLTSEYTVHDATLYLFNKNSGVCVAKFSLDEYYGLKNQGTTSDDITAFKEINGVKISEGENPILPKSDGTFDSYYALVILNEGGLADNTITVGTTNYTDWAKAILNYSDTYKDLVMMDANKNFTMTNALGWVTDGGDFTQKPTWLVEIGPDNIYYANSPASHDKVTIYLQRGLAKVTIDTKNEGQIKFGKWSKVKAGENVKDYIKLDGWALDVKNTKAYSVQQLDDPNNADSYSAWYTKAGLNITNNWGSLTNPEQRFTKLVGGTPAAAIAAEFTRLFWAVDPNYSGTVATTDFINVQNWGNGMTLIANNTTPQYCLENTFDVANMNKNESTRVIVHGYYLPDQETPVDADANITGETFISVNGNYVKPGEILSTRYNTDAIDEDKHTARINEMFSEIADDEDFTIKYSQELTEWAEQQTETPNEAQKKAKALEWAKEDFEDEYDQVLKALNLSPDSDAEVNYHENGSVYYVVIIRHFNDTELNLTATNNDLGDYLEYDSTNGLILMNPTYPDNKDKYLLGRYGMVRNNWYNLIFDGVEAIGTSYVPQPDGKPDDDPSKLLIDVKINILDWAKRPQSIDLQ